VRANAGERRRTPRDTAARHNVAISLEYQDLLTDKRRVRHRVRVERARVAYIVGLLAPFRQLHLYYVLVPPVEHDAHVSVLAEKERTHRGVRYQVNRDIGKVQSSKTRSRGLTRDGRK